MNPQIALRSIVIVSVRLAIIWYVLLGVVCPSTAQDATKSATLYLRNGDFLSGELVATEAGQPKSDEKTDLIESEHIRWKTSLFGEPGTFRIDGIESVVFGNAVKPEINPQSTRRTSPRNPVLDGLNKLAGAIAQTAEAVANAEADAAIDAGEEYELGSRVETTNRQVVFGDVVSLDDQWLRLRSDRHGEFSVHRDRIQRIVLGAANKGRVFDAVGTFHSTSTLSHDRTKSKWQMTTGWLSTTELGANLLAPMPRNGSIEVQLVVSAKKQPDFLIALAAEKKLDRIKSAFSVETWGSQLVAHRQLGNSLNHTVLVPSLEANSRISLRIYLDCESGRMIVYQDSKLLGEFVDEKFTSREQLTVFLRNNGPDLTVQQFRVKSWNGRTTPVQTTGNNTVQLFNGQVLEGEVTSINAQGELTIHAIGESEPRSFAIAEIDQVVLLNSTPTPPQQFAAKHDGAVNANDHGPNKIGLQYQDGSFVTGRYLGTDVDGITIDVDGIDGPFHAGWQAMARVQFLHADERPMPNPSGLVEGFGFRLHGRVVNANPNGKIMWEPFASQQPVSLNLSNAKVTFDSTGTALGTKRVAKLDAEFTDELHLTNGDTIPCQLLSIDVRHVYVRFADGSDSSVSRDEFKGIRRRPPESYVYQGFGDDEVWHISNNDPAAFDLVDGVLELKRTIYLSRDVGLPERACIRFDARWTGDCTMYVGFGADESAEAVRRQPPNTGYTTQLLENEARRPRDMYGEVSIVRQEDSLRATACSRASGLFGQMFANQDAYRQSATSSLTIDDDTLVNVEVFLDRARRLFSVVANGKTLASWKESTRIDGTAIYFGFIGGNDQATQMFGRGAVVKQSTSPGHVRISNLRVARWPGAMPDEKKERLLTRRLGARPETVTHVLRAFNGDSLRGNLVSVQDDTVAFKSRLDSITVPLEKVSEVIALKEMSPAQSSTAEDNSDSNQFRLLLNGGGSVTMKPVQVTDQLMIGDSSQCGRIAVPWRLISQLLVGQRQDQSTSDLVSWILRSPPPLPDAATDVAEAVSPLIGKPAPDLDLVMLDGSQTKLSDLQGKTVILDFWATWCGPCVAGLPQVMEVATECGDNVVLIAVNQQEDADTITTFLTTHGWDGLSVAFDDDGNAARQFGVSGIPHTVIVDPTGVVRHVHVGSSPNLKATLSKQVITLQEQ